MTEQEYFNSTVERVLTQIGCTMNISITMLDHDTLKGKEKEALGLCWRSHDNNYHITIDEFFVHECYTYFELDSICSSWELNGGKTLEYVVCHELAHIQQWNHCKKHRDITSELLSSVTLPDKYYQYLNKEKEDPSHGTSNL